MYLLPGLVDVHTHLREPGFIYKETIKTGSMAGAKGGYTSICAMPNLNPVPDCMENLQLELDAIKNNIQRSRAFAKDTALRSGIALLYAHWEGAVKNIAYYYLVYVSAQKEPYNKLKNNFLAVTIKQMLSQFEETNKTTLQTTIIDNIFEIRTEASKIPTENIISTNSNLNSAIFQEIMCTIGLKTDYYEQFYKLIDTVLLNMRNNIAHGERLENIINNNGCTRRHSRLISNINHTPKHRFSRHIDEAVLQTEHFLGITAEDSLLIASVGLLPELHLA